MNRFSNFFLLTDLINPTVALNSNLLTVNHRCKTLLRFFKILVTFLTFLKTFFEQTNTNVIQLRILMIFCVICYVIMPPLQGEGS